MPLTTAEVYEIKTELGYNALTLGAVPYLPVYAVFDVVIKPYLEEGGDTTSSTSVTAQTVATPVALTLTSATGFTAGDLVYVDVDSRQEAVTIQDLDGTAMTVQIKNAHDGTYPVTVNGGLARVRYLLKQIRSVHQKLASFIPTAGGLKKADEVEFYEGKKSPVANAREFLDYWRDQLALTLNLPNYNKQSHGCGGRIAL